MVLCDPKSAGAQRCVFRLSRTPKPTSPAPAKEGAESEAEIQDDHPAIRTLVQQYAGAFAGLHEQRNLASDQNCI